MQKRNPNVLNIGEKLFPPGKRSSLAKPSNFWKNIILNNRLTCVYTGALLNEENLSIDHYFPWSFLAHDREWNLIPVDKSINSSKSNKLPDWKYFKGFVELQYVAMQAALSSEGDSEYIENYQLDLKIYDVAGLGFELFENKYKELYVPLHSIARNQGFEVGWVFGQS